MNYLLLATIAILLWSSLALLATKLSAIPPFFLLAVCLLVGGSLSVIKARQWTITPRLLLLGIAGIFGYHFLLFMALRMAPPIAANLLNYLWPLAIVVLAPVFLPGTLIQRQHIIGVVLGFSGAALIITQAGIAFSGQDLMGYAFALLAAFTWASYSLLSKRFAKVSSYNVGLYCLLSSLLSWSAHLALEQTPSLTMNDWGLLIAAGLGPMGIAFYAWDAAMKKGDARIIGTLSYFTPLLSTALLAGVQGQPLTSYSVIALILIMSGAVVSSLPRRA